jgi:hypothetical protein
MRRARGSLVMSVLLLVALCPGAARADEPEDEDARQVPAARRKPPSLPEGQMRSGFAFQASLGFGRIAATTQATMSTNATVAASTTISGNFLLGYKYGRIVVGLGFDLSRAAVSGFGAGLSATKLTIVPALELAVVRSRDERVDFFLRGAAAIGSDFSQSIGNTQAGFQLGPGIRYWLHPSFAFGGVAYLHGDFSFAGESTSALWSIDVALQVLAVF